MSFNPLYFYPTVITNITELNGGLYGTVKATDVYPAVDVTDVTQSPTGTTKPYQVIQLFNFIMSNLGYIVYSPVIAATTANLNATYNNGASGVGATLTNAGTQAAFVLDGIVGVQGATYLVKNQTSAAQNGLYILSNIGSATTNWVLTRAVNFNQSANIFNDGIVFVQFGVTNGGTFWQDSFMPPITVGTTAINWAEWVFVTGSGVVNAGLQNELAYYPMNGEEVSGLATNDNSVLVTNNVGAPSLSTTLPSGLTIPGYQPSLTLPLPLSQGGTNANLTASANELVYSTASAMALLPTTNNGVLVTNGSGAPSISTTLPSGLSIPGYQTSLTFPLAINLGGTAVNAVTTAPTATAWAGWDANSNMSAIGFIPGYSTTATAAGTTTLTVGSNQQQYFTGVTTQTVQMPVTSTLVLGQNWTIVNNSTGIVTIQSSGGNTILALPANSETVVTCILTSGTTAASWTTSPAVSGSGTVHSGTINDLAYYAATGTAVSGLATGNSGVLVTSGAGAPSILAGGTTGQLLQASTAGTPGWSTSTYPSTNAANTLLYASSANVMAALATANNGALITNGSGVPSIGALPLANIATIAAQTVLGNSTTSTGAVTALHLPGTPYFVMQANSTTSTTGGTPTKVTLGNIVLDSGSYCASSRFTPLVAGIYVVIGQTSVVMGTDQKYYDSLIYVTGSQASFSVQSCSGSQSTSPLTIWIGSLNGSTDYVELYAQTQQNETIQDGAFTTYLMGFRIA